MSHGASASFENNRSNAQSVTTINSTSNNVTDSAATTSSSTSTVRFSRGLSSLLLAPMVKLSVQPDEIRYALQSDERFQQVLM